MLTAGDLRTVLIPTPVKTAAYTAHHGDFVLADTTSASVTVTLPLNPPQNSVVGAKQVATAGGHTVTVRAAGPDAFNLPGGATTLTLTLLNQGVMLQYSSGVWAVQSDDLPLAQLDARYAAATADPYAFLLPAGAIAQTLPRQLGFTALNVTSAQLNLTAILLPAGATIGHITVASSSTAAVTPANWWYGLWDSSLSQLAVTADQLTAAFPANTAETLAIAATAAGAAPAFTTTYAGLHYLGFMMKAATPCTLNRVQAAQPGIAGIAPVTGGGSTTGLTSPPAFPSAASALGAGNTWYGYVSP